MAEESLEARVRAAFGDIPTREQKMFGGVCFMIAGNMAACVSKRGLLVRVGKDAHAAALARPHVTAMQMGERVMEGYVLVSAEGVASEADLHAWLAQARRHAETLPPKTKSGGRGNLARS